MLSLILIDHLIIVIAGLWPRSTLLGANLVCLPEASVQRGEVAITIDDGPDPEVTPQVLAILANYSAQASFFCIGACANAYPELCRAIISAGHAIENHGQFHHKYLSLRGPQSWRCEVYDAQLTLEKITERRPHFFRAPAGLRNVFLDPVLQRLNIRLASWTRRGYDTCTNDAKLVLARLLIGLKAGDILLLHDGSAARTVLGQPVILEVLPYLLMELRLLNLKPVTLAAACELN